jgi:ABC-type transport system involved in cytochrome bd biosynthesis fused ATPase/permease subunit
MPILAEPLLPVLALAAVQYIDAAMCYRPTDYVRRCLQDVHTPRAVYRLLTPVKVAAGSGLLLGLVVPYLGVLTCVALVAYFAVAVTMHVRARDIGRNFGNATGIGVVSALVALCYL